MSPNRPPDRAHEPHAALGETDIANAERCTTHQWPRGRLTGPPSRKPALRQRWPYETVNPSLQTGVPRGPSSRGPQCRRRQARGYGATSGWQPDDKPSTDRRPAAPAPVQGQALRHTRAPTTQSPQPPRGTVGCPVLTCRPARPHHDPAPTGTRGRDWARGRHDTSQAAPRPADSTLSCARRAKCYADASDSCSSAFIANDNVPDARRGAYNWRRQA